MLEMMLELMSELTLEIALIQAMLEVMLEIMSEPMLEILPSSGPCEDHVFARGMAARGKFKMLSADGRRADTNAWCPNISNL